MLVAAVAAFAAALKRQMCSTECSAIEGRRTAPPSDVVYNCKPASEDCRRVLASSAACS